MSTYMASQISSQKKSEQRGINPHRISHYKIHHPHPLNEFLDRFLIFNELQAHQLLDLGAVYLNGQRLSSPDLHRILQCEDYLRVHTQPRRFTLDQPVKKIIFAETDEFLIINKPHGYPCHPTLDNAKENILAELFTEFKTTFYLCHRLDIGTEGLLLIAKNKETQTYFMQNWTQVQKIYRAWTTGPLLSKGLMEHWMRPHPRAPKIVASRPVQGWHECKLSILESHSNQYHYQFQYQNQNQNQHQHQHHQHDLTHEPNTFFVHDYTIELLTGRTHQIRAQLSFEQNPILGDVMYGSPHFLPNLKSDRFELRCQKLAFEFKGQSYKFDLK